MFRNPTTDVIVVLVIVLLFFGPKRLPLARARARSWDARVQRLDHRRSQGSGRGAERPAIAPASESPRSRRRPDRAGASACRHRVRAALLTRESGCTCPQRRTDGERPSPHRPRGAPEHRRPPRRAAHAPDHCGVALVIAFALCFWQNQALLNVLNRALPHTPTTTSQHGLRNIPTATVREGRGLSRAAAAAAALSASPDLVADRPPVFRPARPKARARPRAPCRSRRPPRAADHDRCRRVVHDHADRRRLLRPAVHAADPDLPGICVRDPRAEPKERRVAVPLMVAAPAAVHRPGSCSPT